MRMFDRLAQPFDPSVVRWRAGSSNKDRTRALALAYVSARDVMDRLDAVVGPENWYDEYRFEGARTICTLALRVGQEGSFIRKEDGAGDTSFEGEKGGISDAFKRAAVKWGIGRYLYGVDSPWVASKAVGAKGVAIETTELARLRKLLPVPPASDVISMVAETLGATVESVTLEPETSSASLSPSEQKAARRIVGARCKAIGLEIPDWAPMMEKSVLREMKVDSIKDLTKASLRTFEAKVNIFTPGDEADQQDDEDLPF